MKTPLVAIIGRPNVGKSTFFNTIIGKNLSITDDEPGVTRDRIIEDAEWAGTRFQLVDTGGIDFDEANAWAAHIREQVDIAINLADVIIFLTCGVSGVHPHDIDIANLLRRAKKPVILAVNKLDNSERENTLYDFYNLKIGEPTGISCTQRRGLGDLLDRVIDATGRNPITDDAEIDRPSRIAIVGKPNAGKSSIINKLLGENRVMVSDIAGTTRDTVDTQIKHNGKSYILTDTAGIRRKRSIETQTIEHYSVLRALASIRNSDVVVLVIDAAAADTSTSDPVLSEQDVRLIGYAHEMGKPSLVVVNKWDLVEKDTHTIVTFEKRILRDLAFMPYFKSIYISALTGKRVGEVMNGVEFVLERANTRITTGTLNTLITGFVGTTPPPMTGGKRPKFLYCTQVTSAPPTFALFVSDKSLVRSTYLRYLENCLRKSVDLTGTPIKFVLRNRSEK
ncbi:MAG: ribosome biogenesis GTPase Der [Firmicutes bacterium]|nr:ribosome biogenesis GTPase Der [Bacillota bacterium]